jgi:hypothetical protein
MSAAQSAIAPADSTVELSIDLRTKHQHALATDNVHVVADTCADRPSRPDLARVASSSALHAPRSAFETLIESDAFMTFKTNLIFNDIWSVMIVIAIIAWSVAFTISGDATSTSLGFALAKASEIARIMSFCVLAIVAGSSIMLNNIDPSTTGRLATMRSIALAVQNSAVFPYAVSFLSIGFTTQLGLKLLWFTTLESCTAAPSLFGAKVCAPSNFSLPADRVAIIFIAPIIVQVFFPSTRLSSLLCSWLIGCICIALSYARIGVFVDSLNLLTAVFVPIIMFKFDAAMWSSFTLHTQTLRDAERELAAAQRTRALERTLMETEKHAIETREADLRSIMGNVAHDLKTPIQSISMGIELLRFVTLFYLDSILCTLEYD